jgi:hypothetical protein
MSKMPPIPPANRSKKGTPSERAATPQESNLVTHEHHPNAAEKGQTANIKQNTTNKGFFHGRRFDK